MSFCSISQPSKPLNKGAQAQASQLANDPPKKQRTSASTKSKVLFHQYDNIGFVQFIKTICYEQHPRG